MSSEPGCGVAVKDLRKTFYFYAHPLDRFVCWASRGRWRRPQPFHALRDVTFGVTRGSSTAIIGANGAGKSTLLKLITGTLEPTSGSIELHGRVASLLELGTGFHPLFTGRQNIVYNARFLGLTNDEIAARLPEIEAFSELDAFLDRPLRTYSSGMQVRLAFSVAASVCPDVLILDEVLAVGDAYFQQKCVRRIRQFRDDGVTILFVSHDPSAVTTLCDRALLLHEGAVIDDGRPADVLSHYNALIARKKADSDYLALEQRDAGVAQRRSGSFDALISDVELLDGDDRPARAFVAGSPATVRIRVFFLSRVAEPTVGILVRDRLGNDVYGTNTYLQGVRTGAWRPGETLEVRFRMELDLGAGEYSLTTAAHSLATHVHDSFDWIESALLFRILARDERSAVGVASLRPTIEVDRVPLAGEAADVIGRALGTPPTAVSADEHDGRFLRSGWHAREGIGRNAFRWTDRECTLFLLLSGSRLRFEVAADRPPGARRVTMQVLTLGSDLGTVELDPDAGWQEVTLQLPPDHVPGPAHLRLVISDGWRPADTGHSDDARVLGVRVRRIWSDA